MQPLQVNARSHDGRTVVRLRGELDIANAEDLRQKLTTARQELGEQVVLDLTDLEFMDSHGLSVIIHCYKAATAAGGGLTLAAPRPIVRRTLEVTGLTMRMNVTDSLDEALAEPAGATP
ncbi:STAS domain-containing protein [Actinomadura barringtoniae]|uniref:Anti-sigma factor antagonist n=1 Tax=Actinomadura barringtoniae TaxID=1427535 RepID=A0A939PIW6_9ACTN|nr:STAS domain-containing protein [Actinomadura barringtoniae]MBO2453245.1 STAS domain-containing protein [Actinomadura barringtoniae]